MNLTRAIRTWRAKRRLEKLVAANLRAPATRSYASHRQAALKCRTERAR
jgi:hypothetical protein